MKIISSLGYNPGGYRLTTYVFGEQPTRSTKFFQTALVEFYQPTSLHILLTPTSETKVPANETQSGWDQLQAQFHGSDVELIPVRIPETSQPNDIWTIFTNLTEQFNPGDEVIVDITHGFRSLPVIALVALVFIRSVKKITIKGLVYGAFDATHLGLTPVYDLMPIVSLLDWTTATDQFLKTGNGMDLADLLGQSDSHTLQSLGQSIAQVSQGLQMLRPMDVLQASHNLSHQVNNLDPEQIKTVPPVSILLNQINDEYGAFALDNPIQDHDSLRQSLVEQLKMIEWYAEKGKIAQCLALAREWLPSLICWHFQEDPLSFEHRMDAELLLGGGQEKREGVVIKVSRHREEWGDIPEGKKMRQIWEQLANLRNDVVHAGFRKNPRSAQEILKNTLTMIEKLKEIAIVWKFI